MNLHYLRPSKQHSSLLRIHARSFSAFLSTFLLSATYRYVASVPATIVRRLSWNTVAREVADSNPGRATQAVKIAGDNCCLTITSESGIYI